MDRGMTFLELLIALSLLLIFISLAMPAGLADISSPSAISGVD